MRRPAAPPKGEGARGRPVDPTRSSIRQMSHCVVFGHQGDQPGPSHQKPACKPSASILCGPGARLRRGVRQRGRPEAEILNQPMPFGRGKNDDGAARQRDWLPQGHARPATAHGVPARGMCRPASAACTMVVRAPATHVLSQAEQRVLHLVSDRAGDLFITSKAVMTIMTVSPRVDDRDAAESKHPEIPPRIGREVTNRWRAARAGGRRHGEMGRVGGEADPRSVSTSNRFHGCPSQPNNPKRPRAAPHGIRRSGPHPSATRYEHAGSHDRQPGQADLQDLIGPAVGTKKASFFSALLNRRSFSQREVVSPSSWMRSGIGLSAEYLGMPRASRSAAAAGCLRSRA